MLYRYLELLTMFAIKYLFVSTVVLLSLHLVYTQQQQQSEVCNKINSATQLLTDVSFQCNGNTGNNRYSNPIQGLPGKRGPKGQKGDSSTYEVNEEKNRRFSTKLASLHQQLTSVQEENQRLKEAKEQQLNNKITRTEERILGIIAKDDATRSKLCGFLQRPSTIEDGQLTASAYAGNSAHYAPSHGRLLSTSGEGCWAAGGQRANDWIQVDLGENMNIVGVATQGRSKTYNQWVTSYTISFKTNGGSFQNIENESGETKVFAGNSDMNTVVSHKFVEPINARYFRLIVVTWSGYPSMRFDLYQC